MKTANRVSVAGAVILLGFVGAGPALAQENSPLDLTGTWRWINHEDERDRNPGAYPGDYRGIPLNDAARMRADTYDEEINATSLLLQCRPRTPGYQAKGLDPMRIDKVVDPVSRQAGRVPHLIRKDPGRPRRLARRPPAPVGSTRCTRGMVSRPARFAATPSRSRRPT